MVFVKEEFVAISREILTSPAAPIPPPLRGSGARRVHNTMLSSLGYPEATPNVKGFLTLVLMPLLLRIPLILAWRSRQRGNAVAALTPFHLSPSHHLQHRQKRLSLMTFAPRFPAL